MSAKGGGRRGLEGEEVALALASTRATAQAWVGEVEGKLASLTTGHLSFGGVEDPGGGLRV